MCRLLANLSLIGGAFALAHTACAAESTLASGPKVVARVADEPILAADLSPYIDSILAARSAQGAEALADAERKKLAADRVNRLIDTKLLVLDARDQLGAEKMAKVAETAGHLFDEKEIPRLLRKYAVSSREDLEARLTKEGTSLERQKQAYLEEQIALGWLQQQIKVLKPAPGTVKEAMREYVARLRERYPVKVTE